LSYITGLHNILNKKQKITTQESVMSEADKGITGEASDTQIWMGNLKLTNT